MLREVQDLRAMTDEEREKEYSRRYDANKQSEVNIDDQKADPVDYDQPAQELGTVLESCKQDHTENMVTSLIAWLKDIIGKSMKEAVDTDEEISTHHGLELHFTPEILRCLKGHSQKKKSLVCLMQSLGAVKRMKEGPHIWRFPGMENMFDHLKESIKTIKKFEITLRGKQKAGSNVGSKSSSEGSSSGEEEDSDSGSDEGSEEEATDEHKQEKKVATPLERKKRQRIDEEDSPLHKKEPKSKRLKSSVTSKAHVNDGEETEEEDSEEKKSFVRRVRKTVLESDDDDEDEKVKDNKPETWIPPWQATPDDGDKKDSYNKDDEESAPEVPSTQESAGNQYASTDEFTQPTQAWAPHVDKEAERPVAATLPTQVWTKRTSASERNYEGKENAMPSEIYRKQNIDLSVNQPSGWTDLPKSAVAVDDENDPWAEERAEYLKAKGLYGDMFFCSSLFPPEVTGAKQAQHEEEEVTEMEESDALRSRLDELLAGLA
eukprot:GHVL01031238.1.p1 GENE.GHVL01031238.1~~GHVL01031238.1.p1  ORF type:complete len:490 (-),score=106.43 GHVL01031238.1:1216-2685(-)